MRTQDNKRRPAACLITVADIEVSANGCDGLGTKDSRLNLSRATSSRVVTAYPGDSLASEQVDTHPFQMLADIGSHLPRTLR